MEEMKEEAGKEGWLNSTGEYENKTLHIVENIIKLILLTIWSPNFYNTLWGKNYYNLPYTDRENMTSR